MKEEGCFFLEEVVKNIRVVVIGDVMLDCYIRGRVERISPEAPVPVNLVEKEFFSLGGAGNTAANLSALGCQVYLAGMVGQDNDGRLFMELIESSGVNTSAICENIGYRTTTKLRILGAHQQMLRLDFEEKQSPTAVQEMQLKEKIQSICEQDVGAIVVSDYGKGFLTESLLHWVIAFGKQKDIPVLVDPKGGEWDKYRGAYGLTPNLKELSECYGKSILNENGAIEEVADRIRKQYGVNRIFVTRSEKGITLVGDELPVHCASVAKDVFDVSGAGDTVMAVLAAATAAEVSSKASLELANIAAGIAVSHVGTYRVSRKELLVEWKRTQRKQTSGGAISIEGVVEKVRRWQERGETVVFTNGCFDILHRGHVTYLEEAATLGKHLVIGLNSDASVKRLKGDTRPINKAADRALLLSALRVVDEVVIFEEDTPERLLSRIRPDVLVKGGDYCVDEVIGGKYAKRVEILRFVNGYSTTNMIEKLKH